LLVEAQIDLGANFEWKFILASHFHDDTVSGSICAPGRANVLECGSPNKKLINNRFKSEVGRFAIQQWGHAFWANHQFRLAAFECI
jgi:hypothetical protein